MKTKTFVVGMAVLLAALLAFAGVAQSAMWAGAEIGGNFPTGTVDIGGASTSAGFAPTVIGGATIGYDFVNSGFGAYNWPDWMKYFSFATDITYNNLKLTSLGGANLRSGVDGYAVALTFLFMAHYGLFPDAVIPTGRVNPYIGVGPAVVWSGLDLRNAGLGRGTSTNIALVVEPGIRWVAFPHLSFDTAFRWRYTNPTYEINGVDVKVNPLNQFTFLIRANYHF